MPTYGYVAADQKGRTIRGRLAAGNQDEAGGELSRRGLVPLRLRLVRTLADTWRVRRGEVRWRIEDNILFTRKFGSLVKAGIPLLKVLGLMAEQMTRTRVRLAVQRVGDLVASGKQLYEAMGECPGLFDRVYLGAIRTGETTGHLDTVLEQTADYLEREMLTRRKVKEALRYPIMVVAAIMVAAVVVLKFVVPRFLSFYENFGSQLPAPTRFLMGAAGLVGRLWWLVFPLGIAVWFGWRWTTTPRGRLWRDRLLLGMPLIGSLFLKVAVSRFARLFGVLYAAGVPATSALDTVAEAVGNVVVGNEVTAMRDRLTMGGAIAAAPARSVIPDLVYQMIGIGFESGEVDRMLGEVARHYEQEIDYDVRRLTDRLQPVLLVFLAGGVLLLALAVLLPMWNLITIFKP